MAAAQLLEAAKRAPNPVPPALEWPKLSPSEEDSEEQRKRKRRDMMRALHVSLRLSPAQRATRLPPPLERHRRLESPPACGS